MILQNTSQRNLLISLPILFLLILSYEVGIFNPSVPILTAQYEAQPIVIQKGGEYFTIPIDSWVVLIDKNYQVIGSGKLIDANETSIKLMEKSEIVIFKNEIGSLYFGEAKRIGYYMGKGFKVGGILGFIGGGIASLMCIAEGYDAPDEILLGFGIGTVGTWIYAIPGATAIGLLTGLVKNESAKKFIIDSTAWEFSK